MAGLLQQLPEVAPLSRARSASAQYTELLRILAVENRVVRRVGELAAHHDASCRAGRNFAACARSRQPLFGD
eukprot:6470391-Pyramimonas_sp.AAC.1